MKLGRVEESIPNNLEESIRFLKNKIPSDELKEFKELSEQRVMEVAHYGLGRHLRNTWRLWQGSLLKEWFLEHGIRHPDDMSGIIIVALHRTLNNQSIEFEKQVENYKKYWNDINENS